MPSDLKIASFNIRHGKGMDGKVSLSPIIRLLQETGAHIIGLQEVDKFIPRSFFQNQTQSIARRLRARYAFAPNLKWFYISGYGNATISMFPVVKTSNTLLPGRLEQRGLQYCQISLPAARTLHFFNTHLGLSASDREAQAGAIIKKLPGGQEPVILTGDFNTPAGSPELQPLGHELKYTGAGKKLLTYPSPEPLYSIDHIFISAPWRVLNIFTMPSLASDHLPLVCRLQYTGK